MAKVEIKKTSGGGGGGGGNVNFTSVTYAELVGLIGTSGLVQGDSYLITDFQTIYDQPDYDAAGLPKAVVSTLSGATEPIIAEAISTNEISNQALSTVYENDQLLYDWTFQTTEVMSVAAKGRITQRTDNNNNVLPYDFRVVVFKRYESVSGSGIYNSYKDTGFASNSAIPTFGTNAYNNSIPFYKNAASPFFLPNNVFGNDCYDNIIENLFYNNTFGNECNANNIGYNFLKNLIGNQFWKNNVGTDFESNIIGNAFRNNKVLNRFAFNTIADNFKQNQIANNFGVNPAGSGSGNTIGSEFNFNVVGEHFHNNQITGSFLNNNVGDIFSNNTIGIRFRDNNISNYFGSTSSFAIFGNTIGDDFKNNQIGETFSSNTVGTDFVFNVLGDECYVNGIGNEFIGNNIGNYFQYNPIIGNYFKSNNIANYFWYNVDIGDTFQNNQIGDFFGQNTVGLSFINNSIGNNFGTDDTHTNLGNLIDANFQNNQIGNNFQENIYIGTNFQRNYIENNFKLNNIGNSCQDNYIKSGFASNVIDLDFKSNNIADGFVSNNILQDFKKNNIGQNFYSNTILNNFELNVIGNDFYLNADIKNDFKRNNIGNSFYQNVLIDDEFQDNVIGNFFYNNTISTGFKFNSIGNTFQSNDISGGFERNSILNNFNNNTVGVLFSQNQIGNYFQGNTSIATNFKLNQIGDYFKENISISDYFQGNQIGSYFGTDLALSSGLGNTIGYNFASNVIGDFFNQNTVQNDVTNMNIEGYFQSKLILATTNTKTWIGGLTTGFVNNTDGFLESQAYGLASQYVRADGQFANFPSTGGGSTVNYYLNGSVNQGTFGGNTYYEMSKTPVIGTGTDFTIAADGFIARFITDAGDPALLSIPSGNWNLEFFFSASSSGGSPSFYANFYKYDGATFTLIGSNSTAPEAITNGTLIDAYFTLVSIPATALNVTDRLAIDIYVVHSGRTITLHTEDNHLCEIITTFSTGLTALNGLTNQVQYFATGTSGTDFAISSVTDTHTFNLPTASETNRGALSSDDWTTFNTGSSVFNFNNFI